MTREPSRTQLGQELAEIRSSLELRAAELASKARALRAARGPLGRLREERQRLGTVLELPRSARRRTASLTRALGLNLITATVTACVLAAIGTAAYTHERARAAFPLPSYRLVGVTTDPWHMDEWSRAVGARLDIVANFMAWGYGESPRRRFREARRRKLIPLITWEPWVPRRGTTSGAFQPSFSNRAIAAGAQDPYIRRFARDCASFRGPVFLRFAHEMNGFWYPWHHDPAAYVAAWRRIHNIFAAEGARNVLFVWAPNPPHGSYGFAKWRRDVSAYWPGTAYVDWVGTTTIGRNGKTVPYLARRVELLREYGKPIMMAETYAVPKLRATWLPQLRDWLARTPWVRAVVWSEGPRAQSLLRSRAKRGVLGEIARDGRRL